MRNATRIAAGKLLGQRASASGQALRELTQRVKFHFSLSVNDLKRSVQFYRARFDCEPAMQHLTDSSSCFRDACDAARDAAPF